MTKKILLIEDDETVRENTAEILELSNYQVTTAVNGKKGVEAARSDIPDIIVCDIMMPEMDGYDVLNELSTDTTTSTVPFIFLSAKTDHKDVRKGMNLGADDYLTKPFEEDDLITAIESRIAKTELLEKTKAVDNYSIKNLKKEFFKYPEHEIKEKEYVYEQGGQTEALYLVKKGVIKTCMIDRKGKELITNLCKPDDIFGDLSLSTDKRQKEFAVALEDSSVHKIPKPELELIIRKHPTVLKDLIHILDEHLSETKDQLLEMAYSSVQKKTAQTILLFSERLKKNKLRQIRISRADLAAVAGIASESLIRTLSKFKEKGIIEIEGRNIKIIDFEALGEIE